MYHRRLRAAGSRPYGGCGSMYRVRGIGCGGGVYIMFIHASVVPWESFGHTMATRPYENIRALRPGYSRMACTPGGVQSRWELHRVSSLRRKQRRQRWHQRSHRPELHTIQRGTIKSSGCGRLAAAPTGARGACHSTHRCVIGGCGRRGAFNVPGGCGLHNVCHAGAVPVPAGGDRMLSYGLPPEGCRPYEVHTIDQLCKVG